MIKHIVMWKLKEEAEGNSKAENIGIVKEKLLALKPLVPQIDTIEVGVNFNTSDAAYDVVLSSTHQTKADLAGYAKHPAHKEAANFIGKVVAERRVVDFEF